MEKLQVIVMICLKFGNFKSKCLEQLFNEFIFLIFLMLFIIILKIIIYVISINICTNSVILNIMKNLII